MSELGQTPVSDRRGSADGGHDEHHERARALREALIGQTIAGRYVLRGLVGHGGMGAVYEAEHLGLGKRVAIKFIDQEFATDERVVARFAREARAMSAIESAHIVTVFDAGTEAGRPYLVMELLRGEDLGQRLRRMGRVALPEAMHIVAQVLKGLAKAHAAGIVHRDLKPDNVFIIKSDSDPLFAKIVDFGVSKIERPRDKTSPLALTGRGTVLGTPFYMCPEQAQAMPDVDARADIYSVGAILFECLTGRPPHTGETYEQIILSICMRDAPDVRAVDPTLSAELAGFVARALSRDRDARFSTAERMLASLHEIAPDEKQRVPLDMGAADTLMSPGVVLQAPHEPASAPRQVVGAETRIAGSASASGFDRSAPARPERGAPARPGIPARSFPEASRGAPARARGTTTQAADSVVALSRRKRSITPIVLTAVIATLLGIGVMLAVITILERRSTEAAGASAKPRAPGPPRSSPATNTNGSTPPISPAPDPTEAPAPPTSNPDPASPHAPSSPAAPASPSDSTPLPTSASSLRAPPGAPGASVDGAPAKRAPVTNPTGAGGAKPDPTKSLDISRDLP